MPVQVVATGTAAFGRRPDTLVDLLTEAGQAALEGIGRKPFDLLVVGHMAGGSLAPMENVVGQTVDRLGGEGASGFRVEAASATGAAAFHVAVGEVLSGRFDRALVIAGEKMTDRPTADVAEVLARSLAPEETAVGATMPALASLVAQRYFALHHTAEDAMSAVSVQARERAARNPYAHFRQPVTDEEVRDSRPVALPLRLLHCSAPSDGASAAILERGTGPATVLGLGQGIDRLRLVDREELTSFKATRLAAARAYESAHLTRKDIQFAELHDAFAPFAFIDLEDIGACGPGEGPEWFAKGWTRADGRFPVNPSGGLLGRGHPVGASGLAQVVEVTRQLTGDAGPVAVANRPTVGLAQSIGGLASHNFVTILGGGTPT